MRLSGACLHLRLYARSRSSRHESGTKLAGVEKQHLAVAVVDIVARRPRAESRRTSIELSDIAESRTIRRKNSTGKGPVQRGR